MLVEATNSAADSKTDAVQSSSQNSPSPLQVHEAGTSPTSAMMLSPPPPPNLPTSSPPAEYHQPDAPDTKEGIEELCPVCGDKVSGYHYGLLTCESCKGFFKRTVQNKKVYTCVADRSCHIDKSQRKRCPFCRFQKCLDVGMKLEAVRADRMRGGRNKFGPMYKRDRARRLQMMRQKQMTRTPCQGPGEVVPGTPTPPFHNSGVTSPPLYGGHDTGPIKQELIQIPQLSSSTSSPDSSPSPLTSGVKSLGNHFGHHPPTPLQVPLPPAPMTDPSKVCWVPPGTPSPPGGHGSSPPSEMSSPKPFHPHDGSNPSSAGGALPILGKVPALIQEFQTSMIDDKEWQSQLFALLQNQTYNQCEVDLFELLCKVIDQSLFAQVDWARNSIYFKDLKVDDQMKLLQNSWSGMLVLDHIHQRLHHGLPDETTLPNGQKFDLLTLALLGLPSLIDHFHRASSRLQELKFDQTDYMCLKFLLLVNPEVRGLSNMRLVHEAHEQAQQALLEYTVNCYPHVAEKFSQLLQVLPELSVIGSRGEDYLYFRHMNGNVPTQTLLMEMLHAKKK